MTYAAKLTIPARALLINRVRTSLQEQGIDDYHIIEHGPYALAVLED